jgi:fatty-acyl-CoA synthase
MPELGATAGETENLAELTLWDRLSVARRQSVQISVWDGRRFRDLTWDRWRSAALSAAAAMRRLGVEPGSRVACVLTNSPECCTAALGVWMAGATVVSLPTPARGGKPQSYIHQLRDICGQVAPTLMLADASAARILTDSDLPAPVLAFEGLSSAGSSDPTPPPRDEVVFVQYSSGSTSDPRGCALTAGAIANQLNALESRLEVDPQNDVLVSWLPLSHDMGFFGCLLLSYWTGLRLILSSPTRFLKQPNSWLEDCARFGATMTGAPNFAFDVAARVARRQIPARLSLRKCVVAGERVEASTLKRVNRIMGEGRLPLRCLMPAYGLAEAVLAVTMTPASQGPRILTVDPRELESGSVELAAPSAQTTLDLVSAGPPLAGNEVHIRGSHSVGEVCVRSRSAAVGYISKEGLDPAFPDGAIRTGDLGFVDQGDLFITGRIDDMLCVAGRNICARDIETELTRVTEIRLGCCALVEGQRDESASLTLVAEVHDVDLMRDRSGLDRLARALWRTAHDIAGVRIRDCYFLPRGNFPKTPSGKVQRFRCRQLVRDPPEGTEMVTL